MLAQNPTRFCHERNQPNCQKSNDLITAKYRLTIIQQYVLHNVISQIHIEDTDFKKYEVNVRSIAENHGIDTKNAYRYIKNQP